MTQPKKILDDDNKNIPPILLYSYCFFRYGFLNRPGVKKLFLSKAFGLIVLCFSLNSVATTLTTEERICPLGGQRFTVDVLMSFSTFGKRLDLKTDGTYGTDPFRLVVCPNGFVDYKENYSQAELNKLEDLITSDNYQTLRLDNTDYFLLAKIREHMGAHKLSIGWTYLEASWEAENKGNRTQYVQYLNLAIDNFNAAVDTGDTEVGFTYRFLLVELNRLKGDFDSAKLKLKELEANLSIDEYGKVLVALEKELIDSQNSKPKKLPKG